MGTKRLTAKRKQGGFLIGTDRLNPTSAKGINTVLVDADGLRFELQYHTPESYRVKDGGVGSRTVRRRMCRAGGEQMLA